MNEGRGSTTELAVHEEDKKDSTVHLLESRHARARVFAKWIVQKFFTTEGTKGNLKTEAVVIYDVAGGKGEVAFELCFRQRNNIGCKPPRCIIIDPRKPEKYEKGALPKWKKRMMRVRDILLL